MNETYMLLVGLQLLKSDIHHLTNRDMEYYQLAIANSKFFTRMRLNLGKLIVIDIHKILNPNEHFSLKKTIDFAKSNINRIDWYKQINKTDLDEMEFQVNDLIERNLENVKTLRNKQFAHLDKYKDTYKYDLLFIDIYETMEKSEIIYKNLSSHFSNSDAIFNVWKNPPNEIIDLAKFHKIRKLLLDKYLNNDWNNDFNEIWKIINKNP